MARAWFWLALAAWAAVVALADEAEGSHFRYGTLWWDYNDTTGEVVYGGEFAFKSGIPAGPTVGSYHHEGTLTTPTGFYLTSFRITAVDPDYNIFRGQMVHRIAPHYPPVTDALTPGVWNARWDSCCRINNNTAFPTDHAFHHNNPGQHERLTLLMDLRHGSVESPRITIPPIQMCVRDTLCEFPITVQAAAGTPLAWRFSYPTEASLFGNFQQPGPPWARAASVDANTGTYSWDTRHAIHSVAGGNVPEHNFYSTQVMVEHPYGKLPVDFLIDLCRPLTIGNNCNALRGGHMRWEGLHFGGGLAGVVSVTPSVAFIGQWSGQWSAFGSPSTGSIVPWGQLDPGDGSPMMQIYGRVLPEAPAGPSQRSLDLFVAEFVTATGSQIVHTYNPTSSPGPWTAIARSCCWIGNGTAALPLGTFDHHMNNPVNRVRLELQVDTGLGGSPIPDWTPIHHCEANTTCTFTMRADPGPIGGWWGTTMGAIVHRMASSEESGHGFKPLSGAVVVPATGLVVWNAPNITHIPGQIHRELYSVVVIAQDGGKTTTMQAMVLVCDPARPPPGVPAGTVCPATPLATPQWSTGGTPPPDVGRTGIAVSFHRDAYLVSHGGFDGSTPAPGSYLYHPLQDRWIPTAPPPAPRINAVGAVGMAPGNASRTLHYVFGGWSPTCGTCGAVDAYNPVTDVWFSSTWGHLPAMPVPAAAAAAASDGRYIYLFSGRATPDPMSATTPAVQRYDTLTMTWTTWTPIPSTRAGAAAFIDGCLIHVLGGFKNGLAASQDETFDRCSMSWVNAPQWAPARVDAAAGWCGGEVYYFGGRLVGEWDLDRYDVAASTWVPGPTLPSATYEVAGHGVQGRVGGYDVLLVLANTSPSGTPPPATPYRLMC